MHTDLHATDGQISASISRHPSFVCLKFIGADGDVAIYLPKRMDACATMIVGAFNAHLADKSPREAMAAELGATVDLIPAMAELGDDKPMGWMGMWRGFDHE